MRKWDADKMLPRCAVEARSVDLGGGREDVRLTPAQRKAIKRHHARTARRQHQADAGESAGPTR